MRGAGTGVQIRCRAAPGPVAVRRSRTALLGRTAPSEIIGYVEFRDIVGAASATVAIASFLVNWFVNRGYQRTRAMRDELSRFSNDPYVASHVQPEAISRAAEASFVLSLGLAETGRKLAVKRAASAAAVMRRILVAVTITVAVSALFAFSAATGPRNQPVNFALGVIYFTFVTAVVVAVCVVYVRDQLRVRQNTGRLRALLTRVNESRPLTDLDLKTYRSGA